MSKKRLEVEFEDEASVIGIVTSLKDYKLAWKINQVFEIELILVDELVINFPKSKKAAFSNYCYQIDYNKIDLVKNKSIDKQGIEYMAKELLHIDYFLLVEGEGQFMELPDIVKKLQSIPELSFVQLIDTTKLKSKDNFIF